MVEVSEICPLTRDAVAGLLASRERPARRNPRGTSRRMTRWPFPGAAEFWVPRDDGTDHYVLATCTNLSGGGIGVRCDEPMPMDVQLAIAVHQPEVSFHGQGIVRHCTPTAGGEYLVGLEFVYD
jgi:hypothetical protein